MHASFTFLRGVALGLSIAAPVGPIGVLCIRRTLAYGRTVGFVSGLGAATADASYGAVAAFGVTTIAGLLLGLRIWLHVVGGLFLCYLGVRTMLARPRMLPGAASEDAATPSRGLVASYGSTLALTLANPATILSFAAIFAGIGPVGAPSSTAQVDYSSAATLVVGVFMGSALWWLLLSTVVGLARARVNLITLTWVNRVSGAVLVAFGVAALLTSR